MKKRILEQRSFLLWHLGLFLLGGASLVTLYWGELLPIPSVGCLVKRLFHLYCPLCGGTRALDALLHLELVRALTLNPLVVVAAVALLVWDVLAWIGFFCGRRISFVIPRWGWIATLGVLFAFFLFRNLRMILGGIDPLGDLAWFWNH